MTIDAIRGYISTHIQPRIRSYSERVTASLEPKKSHNHLLLLDGLRAVACLAVLTYHISMFVRIYHIWSPSNTLQTIVAIVANFGVSGVILFFLLSGFLLFLPFAKALLFDGDWPSVSRFYLRRFFRILPGYYIVLLLVILFFHPEFLTPAYRTQLWQLLTFRMSHALSDQLDGPFWTLTIEFQFYMLLPLLAWGFGFVVRRGTLRWRLFKLSGCLFALLGWGLLTRYWASVLPTVPASNVLQQMVHTLEPYYYGADGKFFEVFAVGMFLAVIYSYTQNAAHGECVQVALQRWSSWIFLVGGILLSCMATWLYYAGIINQPIPFLPWLRSDSQLLDTIYQTWNPLGYTICYGLCMFGLLYSANWLKKPFEWPVLRWIGFISFSLYLWHIPLLTLFMSNTLPLFYGWKITLKYVSIVAWVFFVIFPLSLTCYRWIEMPGIRLGEIMIRQVEAWKKRYASDLARFPSMQTPSSILSEETQEGACDPEKTEPRLNTVLAETHHR